MEREDITDKVIRVEITDEMIELANKLAQIDKAVYGFHNSKNFVSDKTRFAGKLGEVVVSTYFEIPLINIINDQAGYDIILHGEGVEIKTTSQNSERVWSDYNVNVLRLANKCDKYMFVLMHNSYRYAWIVGEVERRTFNDNCRRGWYKGAPVYRMHVGDLARV